MLSALPLMASGDRSSGRASPSSLEVGDGEVWVS